MTITGIIYCPMFEELEHVREAFPMEQDLTEQYGFLAYKSAMADFELIVTSRDEQGVSAANATIRALRKDRDIAFVFCVGIAGALSDDVSLGDVCYSQEIIDINENQKVEGGNTKYTPRVFGSNTSLDKRMGLVTVHPNLVDGYKNWQKACESLAKSELQNLPEQITLGRRTLPITLKGPIVCGPVVADKKLKTKLKAINRKVLAVETETGGIYQSFDLEERFEVVAVRGISDMADDTKKVTEEVGKQAWRRIAARNAATFLKLQLESNSLFKTGLLAEQQATLPLIVGATDPVEQVLRTQGSIIDSALAELSPQFRAKPKGYVLPVPRVRQEDGGGKPKELEPLDLLGETKTAILDIPSSYPDKGLPWLYARFLLGAAYQGRVLVPIVVDAGRLRPPVHGLVDEIEALCPGVLSNPNFSVVVLLKDVAFSQERKARLILDEAEAKGLRVLLVGSGHRSFFSVSPKYSGWKSFTVCAVSFSSIVQFVATNFSIGAGEAEVIAVRLSDTFRAFNLTAHPSYFAGIPKEMLSRLADSNHRAEFIDLAVTGFLSFLGAGDTKDINLKQRTRRQFLQDIAFRIVFEKQKMTLSGLIDHIKSYSADRDLGLNALEFANSFIENGILHEEADSIQFSIEFIQNYLLAERLVADSDAAKRYFDVTGSDFDTSTFELYSEIGLSQDVLQDVLGRVEAAIATFSTDIGESAYTRFLAGADGTYKNSGHTLTSGRIAPKLLTNLERSADFQERVQKAAVDLLGKESDLEAKQKVLDLTAEARSEARTQTRNQKLGSKPKSNELSETDQTKAQSVRSQVLNVWSAGTVMLGSAAEQLTATIKRKLASDLVRLSALILDDWMEQANSTDFEAIKRGLLDSIDEDFPEEAKTKNWASTREELIDLVVDLVEITTVTSPFSYLMHAITEHARNRVLYESVKTIVPKDIVEEIVTSLWKLELREDAGLKDYKDTVRSMSKDKFLRMMLSNYLVYRAYWYRSNDTGRDAYVAAVEHTIKSLNLSMPLDSASADGLDSI